MNLLVYAEAFSRLLSSELFKLILMVGGVVLLLRWCNAPSVEVVTPKHYRPVYGQLTYDLLDSAVMRTVTRNPDLDEEIVYSWADDTVLMEIDSIIETRMKKWFIHRLTKNGLDVN